MRARARTGKEIEYNALFIKSKLSRKYARAYEQQEVTDRKKKTNT